MYHFIERCSIAYCLFLPNHSITIKKRNVKNKYFGLISGIVNRDRLKTPFKYSKAWVMVFALKNTQAKVTKVNVKSVLMIFT